MPTAKSGPSTAHAEVARRSKRRELRHSRSREEILEAARTVLLRKGIAATTLAAVAKEVGVSKTALYYYFPSKDALLFELVFENHESQAQAIQAAVERTDDGAQALGAVIRSLVTHYAQNLDEFRLAYLHAQVAGRDAVHVDQQQLARIRPLNELCFSGAAKKLGDDQKKRPGRAQMDPRMLTFLAFLAGLGLLTMKGMVENLADPLIYSDEQLIEGFERVFAAAAVP